MGLLRSVTVHRNYGIRRIVAYTAILVANYAADRLTKLLAVHFLKGGAPRPFFDGLAILAYIENRGAFLGMGAHWPQGLKTMLFIVVPLAACAAGLLFAYRGAADPSEAAAVLCVIGGGLGNLQDRVLNDGRVVDFMNFGIGPLRTGVLNFGDLSVTFGAIALAYFAFRNEAKRGKG